MLLQLLLHVEPGNLPPDLGGSLQYDHQQWLNTCHNIAENKVGVQ